VLSRARRKVLVIDSGSPRNAPAPHMHGFLSVNGMPASGLLEAGRDEVRGYEGEIRAGAVTEQLPFGRLGILDSDFARPAGFRPPLRCPS
jgi:hypothetical protein